MLKRLEEYTNERSGWRGKLVVTLDLSIARYQLFRAKSYFLTYARVIYQPAKPKQPLFLVGDSVRSIFGRTERTSPNKVSGPSERAGLHRIHLLSEGDRYTLFRTPKPHRSCSGGRAGYIQSVSQPRLESTMLIFYCWPVLTTITMSG